MRQTSDIKTNLFVSAEDDMISPIQPRYLTRSNSNRKSTTIDLNKQASIDSFTSFKKPSATKLPKVDLVKPESEAEPEQRKTMDVSDEDKSEEAPKVKVSEESQNSSEEPKKKKKKRRDVIFKTILRECRRYFQIQLSDLTGFISSKKTRNDDYMYKCMEKFNKEFLNMNGHFEENFYLACLLYPQDLIRNLDTFMSHKEDGVTDAKRKAYKQTAQKIHDTLYKYSHDKLDFFVQKPQLSFLF